MRAVAPWRPIRRSAPLALAIALAAAPAVAADAADRESDPAAGASVEALNPFKVVSDIGRLLPGDGEEGLAGDLPATMSILALLTILTLAPSLLILCSSFIRITVVLALLRQAIGTQSLPPAQVITGLALFLTFLIMAPTLGEMHEVAILPLHEGKINEFQAWQRARAPLRMFMFAQIDHADNWGDVHMILHYRGERRPPEELTYGDVDMLTLIPAFVLSELKVAFLIGFRLYLPFLIIDMVISGVLISMGMLMLPPVLISLPFKLLMFVLVDGWRLVTVNLLGSFAVPGVTV